ncbi:uncharacterized protein LOC124296782 isoform X5 [Neodiprion virginianus]|uniref:uncharacterized protein LOC124296782 isoform X5 n=1 Tax=Neodiprion virginianus TaxID=2961670 RepID=UPI001EE6EB38|nr:uncharacterized protein LOC124296782 isoform X5 [Neodiprion virginianus]
MLLLMYFYLTQNPINPKRYFNIDSSSPQDEDLTDLKNIEPAEVTRRQGDPNLTEEEVTTAVKIILAQEILIGMLVAAVTIMLALMRPGKEEHGALAHGLIIRDVEQMTVTENHADHHLPQDIALTNVILFITHYRQSRSATGSQGIMKREQDQSPSSDEESPTRETEEAADQELYRQRRQQPSPTPDDSLPGASKVVVLCPESMPTLPAWIRSLGEQFVCVVTPDDQARRQLRNPPPPPQYPRRPIQPLGHPFPYFSTYANDEWDDRRIRYPYPPYRGPSMGAPRGRGGWYRQGERRGRGGSNY